MARLKFLESFKKMVMVNAGPSWREGGWNGKRLSVLFYYIKLGIKYKTERTKPRLSVVVERSRFKFGG